MTPVDRVPTDLRPRILHGHVLEQLRSLPEGSVQCVVTSPPYWGLRAYGTEPQVWGGEPGHAHEWVGTSPRRPRAISDVADPESKQATSEGSMYEAQGGSSCPCGAWLGELGSEPTPVLFVDHLALVFAEVRRVLRDDGTLWLNLGDTYSGGNNGYNPGAPSNQDGASLQSRGQGNGEVWGCYCGAIRDVMDVGVGPEGHAHVWSLSKVSRNVTWATRKGCKSGLPIKNLVGIPWRVAFRLQADGWFLRAENIWAKPNPMPESVRDRPTRAHEYVFLLTKSPRYFYDQEAVRGAAAPSTIARAENHLSNPVDNPKTQSKWGNDKRRSYPVLGGVVRSQERKLVARTNGNADVPPTFYANLKSVWWLPTAPYPDAHFATFPEALVELCLKAGTSGRGSCAKCGRPYRHEVRAEGGTIGRDWRPDKRLEARGTVDPAASDGTYRRTDLGFKPDCECGVPESVPCLVLDPFCGSGTVLAVARRLGLRSLGIELNPEYVQQARRRAGQWADIASYEEGP